eukprot:760377_1
MADVELKLDEDHIDEIHQQQLEFIQELPYDRDNRAYVGIFSYLGINDLSISTNPVDAGVVDVYCSPLKGNAGCSPSKFIGLDHDACYNVTKSTQHPYFVVDLRHRYVIPTGYALRNYTHDTIHNTGWEFQGSNDGQVWRTLHSVTDNHDLKGKGTMKVFEIDTPQYFNQFRVILVQKASDDTWELSLSGSEIYGKLYQMAEEDQMADEDQMIEDDQDIDNQIYHEIVDLKYDESNKKESGLIYYLGTHVENAQNTSPVHIAYNESNITNGLFHYLNTTYPALDTKPFDVHSSALKGSCQATQFIGLDHAVCYCITQAKECRSDNYFAVHLKNHCLMPSHYALRNYSNGDRWWLTGWNLEAFNVETQKWDVLHNARDNHDLKGRGKIATFEIKLTEPHYYNQFRIVLASNNARGYELPASGFELYGTILSTKNGMINFFKTTHCHLANDMIDIKCNKSNITNGLFNYLNTTYPALDTKPFDVDSSPLKGSCKATQFIGLDHAVCYCITQAKECRSDNYFAVHLKNHCLMPSHYALRNYSNGDRWWLTGWN